MMTLLVLEGKEEKTPKEISRVWWMYLTLWIWFNI